MPPTPRRPARPPTGEGELPRSARINELGAPANLLRGASPAIRNLTKADLYALMQEQQTAATAKLSFADLRTLHDIAFEMATKPTDGGGKYCCCCTCRICCCCCCSAAAVSEHELVAA
jgi:hypothetical protein